MNQFSVLYLTFPRPITSGSELVEGHLQVTARLRAEDTKVKNSTAKFLQVSKEDRLRWKKVIANVVS